MHNVPSGRPLAATKFSVPALPSRYVRRPRLDMALDAGAALPLTVVVGVPGAGKSVLLRSWVQDRPHSQTVWLSCDARDGDPATFWCALTAALATAWPDRWLDVVDMLAEEEPALDDVAITVVNDLADLGEPVVIVIDDFHFAGAAAPSLTTLIERLPAGCRMIIGSRTEPQLALHRLRAHGHLSEIRDAELRLTTGEVAALLAAFEVELAEPEIELLAARTDGWLAGVQMAAVSLGDQSDPDRFLAELARTPRAIMDFLGAEVLDTQPPEIRDFLLATSVLDLLDAQTCAAVTQSSHVELLLRHVEDRNLFLVEVEDGTYRYHHLFADLLRHRLHAEDPDRELALHRRAADFFVENGDPESAIGHLLAAGQEADAFDVLHASLVDAFYIGDGRAPGLLVAKFDELSGGIQPSQMTDLALALAASATAGDADRWIARTIRHVDDLDEADQGRLATAQALMALRYGEAVEIEAAFAEYVDSEDLPGSERYGYVPSLLARSRLWLGDLHGAREICERELEDADDPSAKQVVMASGLAWVACVEGGLTEAERVAAQALAGAEATGLVGHPITAEALCALGRVAFERADFVAARALLEHSISITEDVRQAFAALSQLVLARLRLAEGQPDEARRSIAQAHTLLRPSSTSPLVGLGQALEGRVALETGDMARAEDCLSSLEPGNRASVLAARIAIAQGNFERARDALDGFEVATFRDRLDLAVLVARIAHGRRTVDADARLAEALELAAVEGFVVAVTDDMVELRPQTARLLRSGRVGVWEQAVLDRIEVEPPLATRHDHGSGPLSEREVTVLRYLASRLTYREIAVEIFVSTNTLKTHVQRIFRKLGVSSRMEAVTEGRRLGLL